MKAGFIKYFFLAFFSVISACVICNLVVDPLQYYRRNTAYPLYGNDRWQVASFIYNFSFDTAIIGTSLTQNFSLSNIKEKLGGTPIKLSMAGALIPEQILVLDTAIKSGKLKKVIWGLDRSYFYSHKDMSNSMPIFLYKRRVDAHIKYLANLDILIHSLRVLFGKTPTDSREALESYNSWWETAVFSKNIVLKLYEDALMESGKKSGSICNKKEELFRSILTIVHMHPEIEFIFFFPPYSLAHHKIAYQTNPMGFYEDIKFRKNMLEEFTKIKNVKIFDFETDLDIITNLDNYKDLYHYSNHVSEYMINCISKQKQLVTLENITNSQRDFCNLPHQEFK